MATYYVNATTGNDGAVGSEAAPWKTLQKAVAAASHAAGAHTINVANGTYNRDTAGGSGEAYNYLLLGAAGDFDINGKDITFVGESLTGVILGYENANAQIYTPAAAITTAAALRFRNLTFNGVGGVFRAGAEVNNITLDVQDCHLVIPTDKAVLSNVDTPVTSTRHFICRNCTLAGTGWTSRAQGWASFEISGCTGTISRGSEFELKFGTIRIFDNVISAPDGSFVCLFGGKRTDNFLTAATEISIYNNKCTGFAMGVRIPAHDDIKNVYIADNEIDLKNATASIPGILIGEDTIDDVTNGTITRAVVQHNKVKFTGADKGHGIALLCGCNNAICDGNEASGGDFQYVIKGDGNVVINNYGYGAKVLLLARAADTTVRNNAFYATSDWALQWNRNSGTAADPARSNIQGNIFCALAGADYAVDIGTLNSTYNGFLESNIYFGGDEDVFRFNSNEYSTIAALKAAEAAWVGRDGIAIDKFSIIRNPGTSRSLRIGGVNYGISRSIGSSGTPTLLGSGGLHG